MIPILNFMIKQGREISRKKKWVLKRKPHGEKNAAVARDRRPLIILLLVQLSSPNQETPKANKPRNTSTKGGCFAWEYVV